MACELGYRLHMAELDNCSLNVEVDINSTGSNPYGNTIYSPNGAATANRGLALGWGVTFEGFLYDFIKICSGQFS